MGFTENIFRFLLDIPRIICYSDMQAKKKMLAVIQIIGGENEL